MPVRLDVGFCLYCEENTLQKQVYETRADGTTEVYMKTCTICTKDV